MPDFNAFYESFFSDRRQEQEPMDWEDVPFLPQVSAPFVPTRPPRKMRSLISVQVSEPPSLSANRFPNMRALVPKKDISYPTIIRSAIRPVPHGPDLPIPSPPDTLDIILDDLDQISHISSDSDDGYDPGTNDPELFSQSDLNDLVSKSGYTKFPCFLWEWDSRDRKQHYVKQAWPIRKDLIPGVKNVERQSLVDPKKILFAPLHIKLGLMKQFVKALDKEGECFKYLCELCFGLSDV
ncbi:uncharacterized protein TNCV_4810141 [Trichonephila clavipes]|uniref:Uncharacterized protein n=1 Tax=Trichonephila clavipes TaxID=2585209 RepID=A0A8X6RX74_TRICX|nr:uncharacterized protein TNCV_4810141 [Trichonephila clavipes]